MARSMKVAGALTAYAMFAVLTFSLAACGAQQTNGEGAQPQAKTESQQEASPNDVPARLNAEQAQGIALAHAGVARADVDGINHKTDMRDDRTIHEVEFHVDSTEYDYTIDDETGEIVSFDGDAETFAIADWQKETPQSSDSNAYIGDERAKEVALGDAGFAEGDVQNIHVALDFDDRIPHYEVEFFDGETEYDYDIEALTGKILSYEKS